MADVIVRRAEAGDTERLVAVWRAAVEATHHFLGPDDVEHYASRMATEFFPSVDMMVAESDGVVVGFSGTADGRLEMLFVDPVVHGEGIGSALLARAVDDAHVIDVDVNEQNPGAVAFYRRRGFSQIARSPVDADGRPFPVLHLRRSS
ncbi:GNAT family N-acetyltransferase [Gordonia sp. 'Campus']|uniref:GNAT family N-acetyltransferase n=1 Tax=Gordonia sp. 'Campus' TaxID=2915824 RepID=UPI001EE409F2|nr:GNAT family N-acetyltransferase [Gordonia sp. 'Campus']